MGQDQRRAARVDERHEGQGAASPTVPAQVPGDAQQGGRLDGAHRRPPLVRPRAAVASTVSAPSIRRGPWCTGPAGRAGPARPPGSAPGPPPPPSDELVGRGPPDHGVRVREQTDHGRDRGPVPAVADRADRRPDRRRLGIVEQGGGVLQIGGSVQDPATDAMRVHPNPLGYRSSPACSFSRSARGPGAALMRLGEPGELVPDLLGLTVADELLQRRRPGVPAAGHSADPPARRRPRRRHRDHKADRPRGLAESAAAGRSRSGSACAAASAASTHREAATKTSSAPPSSPRPRIVPWPRSQSGRRTAGSQEVVPDRATEGLQPLLATLVTLYSESPCSPRPLWLDEAFVGVDLTNQTTMMRMLVDFDLDFLVAGPATLVASAQVPAAAIRHIARAPAPLPGVDLSLTLCAGRTLQIVAIADVPLPCCAQRGLPTRTPGRTCSPQPSRTKRCWRHRGRGRVGTAGRAGEGSSRRPAAGRGAPYRPCGHRPRRPRQDGTRPGR